VSDPDQLEVRAAAVLHQDPRLMPRNAEELAAREAAEQREDFQGLADFMVFKLAFEEDDRGALYMDGDPSCLIYELEGAASPEGANALAWAWVGATGITCSFEHLPGVYQAAYISYLRGDPVEPDPTQMMWALPSERADAVPIREFPPRLKPTDLTPEPGTVSFGLLPRAAVDAMYRQRGW
jgi:hypothetical protein